MLLPTLTNKKGPFSHGPKDANANGKAYIGNATIIPCGKRWVYTHIYKIFLFELFGEVTISRNRLCLTDDDIVEWGPLYDCINTMGCWSHSRHMLCMFHALTMQYFEKIYKKLPGRGKGAGRKLSDVGKAYGEKKSVIQNIIPTHKFIIDYCSNTHIHV